MAPVLLNVPCVCNHRPVAYSHLFFTKKFSSIRYVDGEEPSCGPTNRNKEEREREKKNPMVIPFQVARGTATPILPPLRLTYFTSSSSSTREPCPQGVSLYVSEGRENIFFFVGCEAPNKR